MRLGVRDFAARLGVADRTVTKWENQTVRAQLRPSSNALLDRMLQTLDRDSVDRFELALLPPNEAAVPVVRALTTGTLPGATPMSHRDEQMPQRHEVPRRQPLYGGLATQLLAEHGGRGDVDRRTLVLGSGAAAGLSLVAPALALESVRHGLTLSLADQRADIAVDEWQEIVAEYGYSYMVTAPAQLINSLVIDVFGIRGAIDHQRGQAGDRVSRELRRAGALLATLTAMTVANLGQTHHAARWWRTARRLADASGDPETITWVRGREVVRALYEQRPIETVLRLVDDAGSRAEGVPLRALPELVGGKAEALALAGRANDATAALRRLHEIHATLPDASRYGATIFGWGADRLHFTESFVYSHLGNLKQADEAQDSALAAYPASYRRGAAQIELQRALCLVRAGDRTEGIRHAHAVIAGLAPADHIRSVWDLAHRVLATPPVEQRANAAEVELREYLSTLDNSSQL